MYKILIFAGTTEGRKLAEFCVRNQIPADVSSATEYGASLLPNGIGILSGKLNANEIGILLQSKLYAAVIDATHPYAENITHSLRSLCDIYRIRYLRLTRETIPIWGESFASLEQMIAALNECNDPILSTLGSKSAAALTGVQHFSDRIWMRILPSDENVRNCIQNGFKTSQIIAQHGPFSVDENIQHIRLSGAKILLTKESGKVGGYPEKVEAVRRTKIRMMTLCRPLDYGKSLDEIFSILLEIREKM